MPTRRQSTESCVHQSDCRRTRVFNVGCSMARKRENISMDTKREVLHQAGYKCGNPACRSILTIDIHHMVPIAEGGPDTPDNLLALCPNCHSLHHKGVIPIESIRAWKMLLLAMNEAYNRESIDQLAALESVGQVYVSGDGLLSCAGLVAGKLLTVTPWGMAVSGGTQFQTQVPYYRLTLTDRGRVLLAAWKAGDQLAAVNSFMTV